MSYNGVLDSKYMMSLYTEFIYFVYPVIHQAQCLFFQKYQPLFMLSKAKHLSISKKWLRH